MKNKKVWLLFALLAVVITAFAACSSDILILEFYVDGVSYKTFRVKPGDEFDDVPEVPVKDGYKGEWDVKDFSEITSSMRINAVYTKNVYTVSFYVDNVLYQSITEKKGKTITGIPEVPVKDGYTGSWNVTSFAGVSNDTRVDAVYTKNAISVTFYSKDNEYLTNVIVVDGELPNVPQAKNYVSENLSAKWVVKNENGKTSDAVFTNISENMDVYVYEYVTLTLIDGEETKTFNYDVGDKPNFISSIVSEKDGYEFYGWCYDDELLLPVEFPYEFTENITLYAQWVSIKGTDGLIYLDGKVVGYEGEETDVFVPYKYKTYYGSYVVSGIADEAFKGKEITSVSLAGTVTAIGASAFADCSALESIVFPDGSYVAEIGDGAFENCTSLQEFVFSKDTASCGERAFYGCSSLRSLTGLATCKITSVSPYMFYECGKDIDGTLSAVLPKTVASIGNYAFAESVNVVVDFENVDGITEIGEYAFKNCIKFEGIEAKNVINIGIGAFEGCASMTKSTVVAGTMLYTLFGTNEITNETAEEFYIVSVDVEVVHEATEEQDKYVTTETFKYYVPKLLNKVMVSKGNGKGIVKENTFYDFSSVKHVVLTDGITEIESYAFKIENNLPNNERLFTIDFSTGLTKIGSYAFVGRTDMQSVTLNSQLKEIGEYAFSGISGLRGVTVPDKNSVQYVGKYAFMGTEWFNSYEGVIKIGEVVIGISDTYCRMAHFDEITAEMLVGCKVIAPFAFADNAYILKVTLSPSIKRIGEGAFKNTIIEDFKFNKYNVAIEERVVEDGTCIFEGNDTLISLVMYEDIDPLKLFTVSPASLKNLSIEFTGKTRQIESSKYDVFEYVEELKIGNGFTEICEEAFINFRALKSVNIGENVLTIGEKAFYGIESLETFTIGYNIVLETIANYAFALTGITEIELPNSVNTIGDFAFAGCEKLKEFNSPEKLIFIGESAFDGCIVLEKATMGEKIIEIGAYAFRNCNLTEFTIPSSLIVYIEKIIEPTPEDKPEDSNENDSGENGESGIGENPKDETMENPEQNNENRTENDEIVLANSANNQVVTIEEVLAEGILFGNKNFSTLYLSQGLPIKKLFTVSGEDSTELEIPINFGFVVITGGEIIDGEFEDIQSIQSVTLKNVTKIGERAFKNCVGIKRINIPATVVEIGDNAFEGCLGLNVCQIDSELSQLSYLGKGLFKNCTALTYAVFPTTVSDGDWTEMFDGCIKLLSTNIPSAIKVIGDRAFYGCENIISVGMHDYIEEIGESAFENCLLVDFDDVSFGKLKIIGENAFRNCDGMHGIKAENAESIGQNAYYDCDNIAEITVLNESVAFYTNATEINKINIAGTPPADCFAGCDKIEILIFSGTDAESNKIALENLSSNPYVFVKAEVYEDLNGTVENLYVYPSEAEFTYSFRGTEATLMGISGGFEDAVLYLPSTVINGETEYKITAIGEKAFENSSITTILIPSTVKEIKKDAFFGSSSLKDVVFESGSELTIIGENAFRNCTTLNKISFPSSLSEIQSAAFYNCSSLLEINFYANSSLQKIGANAFENNSSLAKVKITGNLRHLGERAFAECTNLEEFDFGTKCNLSNLEISVFENTALNGIIIPETVIEIKDNAFAGFSGESISIPNGVVYIGNEAFKSAGKLSSVKLSNNLKTIGNSAFMNCTALGEILIPDSVVSIGEEAFSGCEGLLSLTLGKNVSSIGNNAFYYTQNLETLTINSARIENIKENNGIFTKSGKFKGLSVIIGNTVEIIPEYFFSPDTVTSNVPLVAVVTFEETSACRTIGSYAFKNITSLSRLVLPISIKSTGKGAFDGCNAEILSEASKKPGGFKDYEDIEFGYNNNSYEDYSYVVHSDKAYLTDYLGNDENVTVPSMINGITVNGVGTAFEFNTSVITVSIPETVAEIGSYYGCTSLKEISIGYAISEITENTFYNCSSLEFIQIGESVAKIGTDAFYGCENLQTVYINSPSIAESINIESDAGYVLAYALSVYYGENCVNVGEWVVPNDETISTGYKLLPETENGYKVYTKLYWNAGKSEKDTISVYLVATEEDAKKYILSVSGSGNMKDYLSVIDWAQYAENIVEINIGKDVISLGKNAFTDLVNLQTIMFGATNAIDYNENKNLFMGSGTNGIVLKIEKDVLNIPGYLMYNNTKLTEIIYEKDCKLQSVGANAFYGCSALSVIDIPNTVTDIKVSAFENCINVKEITIGNGLKTIGNKAFYGTRVLNTVNFNAESMLDLAGDGNVFTSQYSIQQGESGIVLNVGKDVTRVPAYLFYNCANITSITFVPNKESKLEEIGANAFAGCVEITSILIPSTIKVIGSLAFSGAVKLSSILFDGSYIQLERIGENILRETAYYVNTKNWSDGVLYLETYLLKADSTVAESYNVKEETTIIAEKAFADSANLAYLKIPSSVVSIGTDAFSACYNLLTVYIASRYILAAITDITAEGGICKYAWHIYVTQNLIDIMYIEPGTYISGVYSCVENNTIIDSVAYYTYTTKCWNIGENGGDNVKGYLINDIDNLGYYQIKVYGKGNMEDFTEPVAVPWRTYNSLISKISILEGITSVGSYAFMNCTEAKILEFVGYPSVVSMIGIGAFRGCSSLTKITIPENVTEIKSGAFGDCVKLISLVFNAKNCKDFYEANGIFENIGAEGAGVSVILDKGMVKVPANMFNATGSTSGAPMLKEVTFASQAGVSDCAVVGEKAFAYCDTLASVTFAEGITLATIEESAFEECSALTMVTIPRGILNIGYHAFYNCTAMTEVYYNATAFLTTLPENMPFENVGSENGYKLAVSATATCIAAYLFKGSEYLKEIEFAENGTCELIGQNAFEDCKSIKEIVIPTSMTTIELGAFSGCSSLTRYTTPFIGGKVDQLAANRFTNLGYVFGTEEKDGCSKTIQTYGTGNGIYYIPDSLSVVVATKNTNVYTGTFENCSYITRVELTAAPGTDDKVYEYEIDSAGNKKIVKEIINGAYIDPAAFRNCESLFSIKLTEQLRSIGLEAFSNCIRLNSITIPVNVTSIGNNAFYGCTGLTEIIFNAENCNDVAAPSYANLDRENPDKYHEEVTSKSIFHSAGKQQSSVKVTFGAQVKRVPARLFYAPESNISEIKFLGDKCTEIGERAFYGAGKETLTQVTIPSSVLRIGKEILDGTKYYNTGNKWSNGALYINNSLIKANESIAQNYTVIANTFVIADGAFAECSALLTLRFADINIKRIGAYAFENCINLTQIDGLGNTMLSEIGDYAFLNCVRLGLNPEEQDKYIGFNIPSGVQSIGSYAFSGCEAMKMVYIDSEVVASSLTLESSCGGLCVNASTIYLKSTIDVMGRYMMDNYVMSSEENGYLIYIKVE